MYQATTAVNKILAMKKRLKIIQGGSSAGKTIAILLILIDMAQSETSKKVYSVVSESLPHLKRGAIRDFLNIMQDHGYYKEANWNRTDYIYTFETGTRIEFFGADSSDKVRGPRRDVLFLNEANNIDYETYTQLAIRTNEEIYIDYNPVAEFWVHDVLLKGDTNDFDFIIVTYKDNEGLPEAIIKELESRQGFASWWKVYGEGLIGEVEGKVYKGWTVMDDIPFGARLERFGIDFGYTNDPTAIVAIYYYNGGYIIDEIAYAKGMSNKDIADTINATEQKALVIADAAEPKSIEEIKMYKVLIMPATKGAGSINQGIQYVQAQTIGITKRSTYLKREYERYMFLTDTSGRVTNVPIDVNNHAMDAVRYAITSIVAPKVEEKAEEYEEPVLQYPSIGL